MKIGCATGCVLDNPYFKEHYKITAMNFINQQVPNTDLKGIQKSNITWNLVHNEGIKKMFFIIEEVKEWKSKGFCISRK